MQVATQKEIDENPQDRSGIVGEDGRRLVIRIWITSGSGTHHWSWADSAASASGPR